LRAELRAPALLARAGETLARNWREGIAPDGTEYAYTCPAPPRYRHQWYWDSCFHAIVWRLIEPARARAELRTLLAAGDGTGFVPHTAFWHSPAGWRRAPLYATHSFRGDRATASIQTPLLALAWELVSEASDDEPGFATESLLALKRHYDWLAAERDLDGDGLITILLPDESGLDDSPKYDPVFRSMAHHRLGYFWLVGRARRHGYRAAAVAARHHEHVEDVLVNVFYALSLQSLSRLAGEDEAGEYALRARALEGALLERCLDERSGLFFDLAGPDERRVPVSTWSALAPLALSGLPEQVRRRLVEDHLLHPARFRAPTGIPSVSLDEDSFNPGFDRWRCWRGPAWVVIAWLLVPPLRVLGYEEEADGIVASLTAATTREGFREYYNPLTGAGHGARHFGMSTLIADL
jgi:hypothetical protein